MKKIFLLFMPLMAVAFFAQAQITYSSAGDTIYTNLPVGGNFEKASLTVNNTGSTAVDIRWRMLTYFVPDANWDSPGVCDWATCIPFNLASSWTSASIDPNTSEDMYVQMKRNTGAITGCSVIKLEIEQVGGMSNRTFNFIHTSAADAMACNLDLNALSINDFNTKEMVSVYPNPATNYVNLTVNDSRVKSVQLSNIIGRQIKRVNIMDARSKDQQISLTGLPDGLYLLQYKSADGKVIGVHRITKR